MLLCSSLVFLAASVWLAITWRRDAGVATSTATPAPIP
jgi:hypothetical protein